VRRYKGMGIFTSNESGKIIYKAVCDKCGNSIGECVKGKKMKGKVISSSKLFRKAVDFHDMRKSKNLPVVCEKCYNELQQESNVSDEDFPVKMNVWGLEGGKLVMREETFKSSVASKLVPPLVSRSLLDQLDQLSMKGSIHSLIKEGKVKEGMSLSDIEIVSNS
jgi:hypothetical protein